ncbi:kinase-like domain-containing protein, partial [Tribonema minus]
DVTRGVAFLHASKVLHGDLKSPNILIFDNMRAKLTDFGLAKVTSAASTCATAAGAASPKGTWAWMAPEIGAGARHTAAADVFSGAMVMFELLSGRVPFHACANPVQVALAVARGERPPV